jgi:ADP-ribose pyrophosphatase
MSRENHGPTGRPDDPHLVEHFIRREQRLSGGYLHVVRDTVGLPDGSLATREFILHPGAVAVVPLLDDGRVVMVRQFRHPVAQVLLEIPAGKRDPQEPVLRCAQRELREETGYTAGRWARAGVFQNAAAYSTEGMEIWFATDLRPGPMALDVGEFVEVVEQPLDDLLDLVHSGRLTDMKTALALLWLQRWRSGEWALEWQSAA